LSTGGTGLGCATLARLSLRPPILSIFIPDWSAWQKNYYSLRSEITVGI
jgi:hypothetical protein